MCVVGLWSGVLAVCLFNVTGLALWPATWLAAEKGTGLLPDSCRLLLLPWDSLDALSGGTGVVVGWLGGLLFFLVSMAPRSCYGALAFSALGRAALGGLLNAIGLTAALTIKFNLSNYLCFTILGPVPYICAELWLAVVASMVVVRYWRLARRNPIVALAPLAGGAFTAIRPHHLILGFLLWVSLLLTLAAFSSGFVVTWV